jgi:sugar phosphate isomerase/epimerase
MELGLYFAVCNRMPLEQAVDWTADLGVSCVELSAHIGGRFDVEESLRPGRPNEIRQAFSRRDVRITALNMSADGQLLLGPHHADTDWICAGTPDEKRSFGDRRLRLAADLAAELGVEVVTGFVGCEDYSRWFPWPDADAWQKMEPAFVERVTPVLDHFRSVGVRFAMECHPRQFVYNTETAVRSVELLDGHPAWGFNLDPANLVLAGVDPVWFAAELGERLFNVHAKDAELVAHNVRRSGLLANGPWTRPDRGFRFRVPGWGDIAWRSLITELVMQGYRGPLTIEHEDPTMSAREGVEKAVAFLDPLVIREPFDGRWW